MYTCLTRWRTCKVLLRRGLNWKAICLFGQRLERVVPAPPPVQLRDHTVQYCWYQSATLFLQQLPGESPTCSWTTTRSIMQLRLHKYRQNLSTARRCHTHVERGWRVLSTFRPSLYPESGMHVWSPDRLFTGCETSRFGDKTGAW